VPNIKKTSDLVEEIAAASAEQTSGVAQINTAVTQMSQVTQQNAASSEELAATAEQMSAQAEQLQKAMGFFKVRGQAAAAGSKRSPAKPASAAERPVTLSVRRGAPAPKTTARVVPTGQPLLEMAEEANSGFARF
jgi:methyl-accepting chemotaxis protein